VILQRTPDEAALSPRVALSNAPVEAAPSAVHEVAPPAAVEPAPIEMAAEPMRRAPAAAGSATPRADAAAPRAPSASVDLAREVALIDRAMVALKKGDATRALATIKLHAAETRGQGQLAEDAAAIEIEALCRLHSSTVAAKLDAFDARFPRSGQRSRLTTHCQD
jgi:hypothetical protein